MTEDGGECGFCLQQILTRLDDQQVNTTIKKSSCLDGVSIAEFLERDVSERWQFATRAHRTCNPPRFVFRGVIRGDSLRELRGEHVHVVCLVGDVVLGEVYRRAIE